jgi:hypothetical protein
MTTIRDHITAIEATGTSEGAEKGWDTRGRGRTSSAKSSFNLADRATGNRVGDALRSLGYERDMSKANAPGGTYYKHPDGHVAFHANPNLFINRLHIQPDGETKDDREDHLADVERTLQEKKLAA